MYENENQEYMTASDVQEETPTFVDIEDVGSVMDDLIEDIQEVPGSLSDLEGEEKTEAGYMQGIEEELKADLDAIEEILPEPEHIEIELENPNDLTFVEPDNEGGEMTNQEQVEEFGEVNVVSVVDSHDFEKEDTVEELLDTQFNKEEHRDESGLTAPAEVVEISEDAVEEIHELGNDTADTFTDRAINDMEKIEVPLSDIEGENVAKALEPLEATAGTESEDAETEDEEEDEAPSEEDDADAEDEVEVEDSDSDTTEEEVEVEAEEETPADLEEKTEEAEEITGEDLDGDNEEGEDPEHVEAVSQDVEDASDVSAEMEIVVSFDAENQIATDTQIEEVENFPEEISEVVNYDSAIDEVSGVIANPNDPEEVTEIEAEAAPESVEPQEEIKPEELVSGDLAEIMAETSEFHDDEAALVDGDPYDSPSPDYDDIEAPSDEVIEAMGEETIEDALSEGADVSADASSEDCCDESGVNAGPTFVEDGEYTEVGESETPTEVAETEVEVKEEDLNADEEVIEDPANESANATFLRAFKRLFGG